MLVALLCGEIGIVANVIQSPTKKITSCLRISGQNPTRLPQSIVHQLGDFLLFDRDAEPLLLQLVIRISGRGRLFVLNFRF